VQTVLLRDTHLLTLAYSVIEDEKQRYCYDTLYHGPLGDAFAAPSHSQTLMWSCALGRTRR
jgi:hypothetical protein